MLWMEVKCTYSSFMEKTKALKPTGKHWYMQKQHTSIVSTDIKCKCLLTESAAFVIVQILITGKMFAHDSSRERRKECQVIYFKFARVLGQQNIKGWTHIWFLLHFSSSVSSRDFVTLTDMICLTNYSYLWHFVEKDLFSYLIKWRQPEVPSLAKTVQFPDTMSPLPFFLPAGTQACKIKT